MDKEVPENGYSAFSQGWDEKANPFKDLVKATRWTADWWNANANAFEASVRSAGDINPNPTKEETRGFMYYVKNWLTTHGGIGDFIMLFPLVEGRIGEEHQTIVLTTLNKPDSVGVLTHMARQIEKGEGNDNSPTVN